MSPSGSARNCTSHTLVYLSSFRGLNKPKQTNLCWFSEAFPTKGCFYLMGSPEGTGGHSTSLDGKSSFGRYAPIVFHLQLGSQSP